MITFSQMLSSNMALVLVLDRLLATFRPHKYKNWTYRQLTVPFVGMAVIFASVQTAVHFFDSWGPANSTKILLSCAIEDMAYDESLQALMGTQIAVSVSVVVLNCVLAYGVKRQQRKMKVCPVGRSEEERSC